MNRKNAFSYFIWFLYSMLVCVSLFAAAASFAGVLGYPKAAGGVAVAAWLLLCGILTMAFRKLIAKRAGNVQINSITARAAEGVAAVLLALVGIGIRIYCMNSIAMDSVYFDLAKVSAGQSVPTLVHGAEHIYLQLLHLIYVVFGNIFVAGIWLQIVLQIFAGVFLYFAVRKMAGAFVSVIMLLFYSLSPLMIEEALTLSPHMLFLLVFALALFFCAKCICGSKKIAGCIITGMLGAVVCYLDICGVLLLLFAITGILGTRNQTELPTKKCFISAFWYIVGFGSSFFIVIAVDALASGKSVNSILNAWWSLFIPTGFSLSGLDAVSLKSAEALLLVMLMVFGCFSFWTKQKKEGLSIWTLVFLGTLTLQTFGMTTDAMDGGMLLYITASILAGVGICRAISRNKISVGSVWENDRLEAQLEARSRDVRQESEKSTECSKKAEEFIEEQSERPKVQFIENPLPLPKKHVKKVMDFDYPVEDDMKDFDIDVAENDDFDI